MQIISKNITDIHPYANNPRKNDQAVDAVASSIREFGFKVPVVIDKNGEIIAGHTRYKAAKKLKLKEIPCIIADDLTEEQIRALRIGILKPWILNLTESPILTWSSLDLTWIFREKKGKLSKTILTQLRQKNRRQKWATFINWGGIG